MARNKYLLHQINFGRKGDISREIAERIMKKTGKTGFSKAVRDALVLMYSNRKDFKQEKIQKLLDQRKELQKKPTEIRKQLEENESQLKKLGYEV